MLRAIAGLLRPAAGRIALDEEVWFDADAGVCRPPERRSVGLVFQEYALFPHLTVARNVAFGARGDDVAVAGLLDRLRIGHLAGRRPGELSGGERQRVAVARALARAPAVLLLDEPLAALDPDTRGAVRDELARALESVTVPTVLVTHDLQDAAVLADEACVLAGGTVRQRGTVAELTAAPADVAVARLTGANVLPGVATPREGGCTVALQRGGTVVSAHDGTGPVALVVAPCALTPDPAGPIAGTVRSVTPDGTRLRVRVDDLDVELPADGPAPVAGDAVRLAVAPAAARVVPA